MSPEPSPSISLNRASQSSTQSWIEQFRHSFSSLQDPRVSRCRVHLFDEIILMAILAVIAGAKGWEDIENYAQSKSDWLKRFLVLPAGIPCADTFRRLFERLHPSRFESCFQHWVGQLLQTLDAQVIPLDGKTIKGSYNREQGRRALHVVSAWSSHNRLVLGQIKTAEKSNEITAIPTLLEQLDISGATITLDAMGTQTAIAAKIIAQRAHYILALKNNHPTLFEQVKHWFDAHRALDFQDLECSYHQQVEAQHHRIETRRIWAVPLSQLPALHRQQDWAGLRCVVMVERTRKLWNKTTHETGFFLSSHHPDALALSHMIRAHWTIENQLHWVLDVTFAEDHSSIRSYHSPQNFSLLRRMAINALNQETSLKRSTRQKSNRAAMDNSYMLKVLAQAFPTDPQM